jgi:hypothetical protein
VPRLLQTVLVVALLAGTAAAFAVTEELKLKAPAIEGTQLDYKVFSPVCRCPQHVATVRFRLVRRARLTVAIVDGDRVVRTLVAGKLFGRGPKHFGWNGRDAAGRFVPDGSYRPRVRVGDQTIVLPNPILVDTVRPRVRARLLGVRRVRYTLSEPAHPILYANGRRIVRGRWQRLQGDLLVPRRYARSVLTIAAVDLAGNLSRPVLVRRTL